MNKRLTKQNEGQKKPPHHVGEDRDGVYGKENRVVTGVAGYCYYSKASSLSLFASVQPHATDPFVAGA